MTEKQQDTAMSAALQSAGLNREENLFLVALSRYFATGGTRRRAVELIDFTSERHVGE